jgi:hypothetical protein
LNRDALEVERLQTEALLRLAYLPQPVLAVTRMIKRLEMGIRNKLHFLRRRKHQS